MFVADQFPSRERREALREPSESVAVEKLHAGDPITDAGQRYIVLESKTVSNSCVVLELESRVDEQLRVIEKAFPAGYQVGRADHRIL